MVTTKAKSGSAPGSGTTATLHLTSCWSESSRKFSEEKKAASRSREFSNHTTQDVPTSSSCLMTSCCRCCCCCKPATLPEEVYTQGSILWSEEDIPGALVLRNFRSPRKYSSYLYKGLSAAMAITSTHWLCYTPRPMIRIEWKDPRSQQMDLSIDEKEMLVIRWDANLFQPTWQGTMELRLKVDDPEKCLRLIRERSTVGKHAVWSDPL